MLLGLTSRISPQTKGTRSCLSVCLSVQHPPYPGTEGLRHARLLREKPKEWIKAKAIKARHKTNNTTLFCISYKRFTELNRINR